ncbi:S26 family signal peptidase [Natrinema salsiterrestre]|uniref:S26 family signal peptidase n=1 Tax=Natrinema salsiterrestre TaxID=2950540 RepID=A0A9Q4Q4N1_9EURY|nr:S26 family signal peptidase [Natrinema salsiterrestre]MDF9747378.1 S26 family signal peptidase [Natrinema salsiterrestre]
MDGPDAGERNDERSDLRDARSGPQRSTDDPGNRRPRSGATERPDRDGVTIDDDGMLRWFLESDDRTVTVCRDAATVVALVLVIGLLLFGINGTWPPFVAVESGSMEPNIREGDLVFIVDDGRFVGDDAVAGTGIVSLESGRESGHEKFDAPGDVIVFMPNGDPRRTPTIHRAHFWVEAGENWVATKADREFTNGASCNEILSCPAPHDGFITKGDANPGYDQLPQSGAKTTVISPEWVTGKAMARAPWLGEIRLAVGSVQALTGIGSAAIVIATGVLTLVLLGAAAGGRDP